MSEKTKKQKPKNRLYKGSKYSEYKIDQVIRCFSDDLTAQETADKTKISIRSIRPIFEKLRLRMFMAARENNRVFGYAGMFLCVLNRDDLERLRKSERFAERMKKHFPRAPKPQDLTAGEADSLKVTLLLMELIIKDCARSELVKDEDFDRRIIYMQKSVQRTGLDKFIDRQLEGRNLDRLRSESEVMDHAVGLYEQMADVVGNLIRMEFDMLFSEARKRFYSGEVTYRDLRKYILKNPL